MKNKEIKKNTTNSNSYEGIDDKGCHFSVQQTDTGSEEDKKWWNEQVSWHAEQVAEHAKQVPHSQTISFTHRRNEGDQVIENTRVFEIDGGTSSAKITEIADDEVVDNEKSPSVKRQRTDDEEDSSVRKSGKQDSQGENTETRDEKRGRTEKPSQASNNTDKNNSRKDKKQSEKATNQAVEPNKKGGNKALLPLGIGAGVVGVIATIIKVFKR